jgi:hypothetical protein
MASRVDIPNDRQDVGRKLSRLRLAGHTCALNGPRRGRTCPAVSCAPLAAARAVYGDAASSESTYSPSMDAAAAAYGLPVDET